MAKLTLTDIAGQYASTTELNNNFALIETALENTVSRDGTTPNTMSAELDMNSQKITNLAQPTAQSDAARLSDVSIAIATALPDQTSNANKSLRTDGVAASWDYDDAQYVVNTPAGDIAAVTVQAAIDELDTDKVPRTSTTGSAILPAGTTAERDVAPANGYLRFNSDYSKGEIYDGTNWSGLGGATGAGGDDIFYENGQTVTTDYTLTTGKNAMSAGDITVAAGITVTIPTGASWSIV